LFLPAIVCLSLAMVARSRASSPLTAPRSRIRCLLAEPAGGGAEPVGDGLRDVRGLGLQGERAVAELGGLLVGAEGERLAPRGVRGQPLTRSPGQLWHCGHSTTWMFTFGFGPCRTTGAIPN
jgi:hypothetical protein